jgi:hypothetical protein
MPLDQWLKALKYGAIAQSKAVYSQFQSQASFTIRLLKRRHPDSNRGMEVLQTSALPLGYAAARTHTCQRVEQLSRHQP